MDALSMIPQFGGLIWTLLAFVVALSIIVAVHEYGHYIVGRWSGIHAEVFSLGFGPVIWSRVDRRGTVWQVAALPLGGYVRFRGDANASGGVDGDGMQGLTQAQLRTTMHGAPLWARTATVAAGPVFNFILSILVFTALFLSQGQIKEPLEVGSLRALPMTQDLAPGDVLIKINGQPVPAFDAPEAFSGFLADLPMADRLEYTVLRKGRSLTVAGPYPYPPLAEQVVPRSAAWDAGLRPGDVITAIHGAPIWGFDALKTAVENGQGAELRLGIWRDGRTFDVALSPRRTDEPRPDGTFETVWRVGIAGGLFFEPATASPGPVGAVTGAVLQTGRIIESSLSGLYHMITGAISTCNMSGPIGIAETSGAMAQSGLADFIWFIAVLSTAVGLMNLFPVPVLDGGHLVFYAYEAVVGRAPSDRALQVLMSVGLALILGLMAFALMNDLLCP
ncbi:MAG: RIP metalloprotease RseP [Paracoccaceae bacterium]